MNLTPQMKEQLLRQSRERFPYMMSELLWAAIAGNREFQAPPPWVATAIDKFAGPSVEQIRNIPKLILGQMPFADAGEMTGSLAAASAFLENPGAEVEAAEKLAPGLTDQRIAMIKISSAALATIAPALPPNQAQLTAEQMGAFLAGQGRGATAIVSGLAEEGSLTKQICMMMWLFWPSVQAIGNRPKLHQWIGGAIGIKCSRKLVEKICDELGFCPARRGRPRNPTSPEKQVGIKKAAVHVRLGHATPRRRKKPSS